MELSLLRHTNMDTTGTLRHPETILFPAKESAWQPVVAPLSVLQQNIPKESIIANTDFTTTSVIAKRRLSSKKRKKQLDQSGSCDSSNNDSKSSRDRSSPSVSSAHLSPTDSHLNLKSSSLSSSSSSVSSSFRPPPPLDLSASSYPSSQAVSSTATQYVALSNHGLHVAHPQPTQMLSSLPPEMAHQLIHKQQTLMAGQVSVPHFVPVQFPTHPHGSDPALSKEGDSKEAAFGSLQSGENNQGFHWCSAHVLIAQKIRSHQLQLREQEKSRVTQHSLISTPSSVHSSQACHVQAQQVQLEAIQQHIHCQQQIQQQMALLQLYGCVPTVHGVMATAVAPDQLQVHGALPGHPAHQPHPQASQLLGIHLPAVYPTQGGVPMAAVAHNDMSSGMATTFVQGQNGSWLTPVPVVGSCIVNPLQPGMLATSWVK